MRFGWAHPSCRRLKNHNSFYPLAGGRSGTALAHARAAFEHLTRRVGLGKHGAFPKRRARHICVGQTRTGPLRLPRGRGGEADLVFDRESIVPGARTLEPLPVVTLNCCFSSQDLAYYI